uniref:CSON010112 protein n=1 Tax=Culicoides sonorensis TaxID=179676 RepID=A0A336LLI5_CULSO
MKSVLIFIYCYILTSAYVSGDPIVGAERASNRNIKLPKSTLKSEENTVEIRNNWGKLASRNNLSGNHNRIGKQYNDHNNFNRQRAPRINEHTFIYPDTYEKLLFRQNQRQFSNFNEQSSIQKPRRRQFSFRKNRRPQQKKFSDQSFIDQPNFNQQSVNQWIQRPSDRQQVFNQFPDESFTNFNQQSFNQESQPFFRNIRPSSTQQPPRQLPDVQPQISPQYYRCLNNCLSTNEYNPVCGTDGMTYYNMQRLNCANRCGANVSFQQIGSCEPFVPVVCDNTPGCRET